MPTVLTHAALPLIVAWGLGPKRVPRRLAWAAAAAAVLPDLDVIGTSFGISRDSILGHRGASHSIAVAAAMTLIASGLLRTGIRWPQGTAFLFLAALSHGLTDMFTDGGNGIALFWPLSDQRMFAPFRPIEVSPILLSGFMNGKLPLVLASELIWLILPAVIVALLLRRLGDARIDLPKGQF